MTKLELEIVDKVLKSEHWKDNLSGLKWNKPTEMKLQAKHLHEVRLWRAEDDLVRMKRAKTVDDIMELRETLTDRMIDTSIVAALRSPEDPRIKEIGFSVPDDMFLNNFGNLFALCFHGNTGAIYPYNVYNLSNSLLQAGASAYIFTGMSNHYFMIQFGAGTTAPARNNVNIQTAFATAPESGRFQQGPGAYSNGVISMGNLIVAGGSGTINEVGMFWYGMYSNNNYDNFMMTRDLVSPGVAFVAGNPLVGTFAINI